MFNTDIVTMNLTVADQTTRFTRIKSDEETSRHRIKINGCRNGVGIALDGCMNEEGSDETIWIEHCDGEWVVRIWADANKADPTHTVTIKKSKPEGNMTNLGD